jgi:hypothetical protein
VFVEDVATIFGRGIGSPKSVMLENDFFRITVR